MKNNIIKLIKKNDIEGVRRAIEKGADVNIQDEYGNTALIIAILYNTLEIAELLLKAGADRNIKDNYCKTVLGMAKLVASKEMVELFLDNNRNNSIIKKQNLFAKEKQETMDIENKIEKIKQKKSRQLGRLIGELKKIETSQIIIDGVEKYFNFFYLDTVEIIKENQGNNDNSNKS